MFEPPGSLGDAASTIFNFHAYHVIDAAGRPRRSHGRSRCRGRRPRLHRLRAR